MTQTRLPYKYAVAVVAVLALFMDLLDMTILNVALPTLGRQFGVDTAALQWLVTGYLLSLAVFMPVSGWAADRFGAKRTFAFAVALFTAASALCGAAWNIESLIAFRALQGAGGGLLTPVGMALLFDAFPEEERARASVIFSVPAAVAPAVGPVVGGFLVTFVDWRWIFFINVPVGLIAFFLATVILRERKQEDAGRLDVPGFLLGGLGLASLTYGLSQAEHGLADPVILAFGLAGLVLLVAFVAVELRTPRPMIDVRLFLHRPFSVGNAVMFLAGIAFGGTLFVLPLLLQQAQGLTALASGLITAPNAVGIIVGTLAAGRVYDRLGPRCLLAIGMLGTALATFAFLFVDLATPGVVIAAIMLVAGVAFGATVVPLQTVPFIGLAPSGLARGTAVLSVVRQVALAFGTALLATVLSMGLARSGGALAIGPYHAAFLAAGVVALIGTLVAFLAPKAAPGAQQAPDEERAATPQAA